MTSDQHSTRPVSRRQFLRKSAATAAGLATFHIVPRHVLGGPGYVAPSEKINIAMIGVGRQGGGHFRSLLEHPDVRIVGVSEVWRRRLDHLATQAGCPGFFDYQKMLAEVKPDAVVIASPDHWHAKMCVDAMAAGCDVYCEKPLSLTVADGRAIADAQARYNRIFQTGSQQRSRWTFRHACELARNGYVGRIKEVWAGVYPVTSRPCPLPPQPVPDDLDYDRWLGPAPDAPYHENRVAAIYGGQTGWRAWRDYSGGMQTDWGAHHYDIAQWGLGRDDTGPVTVEPPGYDGDNRLRYRYADGLPLYRGKGNYPHSVTFVGTDGWVSASRGGFEASDPRLARLSFKPSDQRLHQSNNHRGDWLRAIRDRQATVCPAEVGHRSATVCHLGNIALWLNRPLQWDPQEETIVGDQQASRLLRRPYREPWRL